MKPLALHEFHRGLGARFGEVNGCEVVNDYSGVAPPHPSSGHPLPQWGRGRGEGAPMAEHAALLTAAGALDLGHRGRICITGGDRARFLNGQVTNNVKDLRPGQGCYAALVTAKGKLQADLNIYCLDGELLLDFEPGLTETVSQRLEKFIIADDAQVVDASLHYGLLSVQGPKAEAVVRALGLPMEVPGKPFTFTTAKDTPFGEIYLVNQPRLRTSGFDLFVPLASLEAAMKKLAAATKEAGGRVCGWQALEMARVEAGIPRYGVDMDESNLAPECLGENAISYSKGCYIGQEVIARVRTYGQVAKALRGLRLADDLKNLPVKGDKLFHEDKEAGYVTSALMSPSRGNIALGYVRKEFNGVATELTLRGAEGDSAATVVELPFAKTSG